MTSSVAKPTAMNEIMPTSTSNTVIIVGLPPEQGGFGVGVDIVVTGVKSGPLVAGVLNEGSC